MYKNNYLKNIPDFKEGLSRIFDLSSTVNKKKFEVLKVGTEADRAALLLDWEVVGGDIRGAINEFEYAGCGRSEGT